MIINNTTQNIIRVLLNEKKIKIRELAKFANVSLGMTVRIVNALESSGLVKKSRGISVLNFKKLLKAWAYTRSIEENKKIQFLAAERPQYLIKKISNLLKDNSYAFTLFSATEIVFPYVAPNKVHMYILESQEDIIKKIFLKEGIMPAEEGNVVCYIVDESYFYASQEVRGVKIINLPQLYIDLIDYSGRGEEAAEKILKMMEEKNV